MTQLHTFIIPVFCNTLKAPSASFCANMCRGRFHISPQTGSFSAPGWRRSSPGIPSPPPDCQPPPGCTPRQRRCLTPAGSSSRSSPPGSTLPQPERLLRPPEEETKPVGTGENRWKMEKREQLQANISCQRVNLGCRIKPRVEYKSVPLIKVTQAGNASENFSSSISIRGKTNHKEATGGSGFAFNQ